MGAPDDPVSRMPRRPVLLNHDCAALGSAELGNRTGTLLFAGEDGDVPAGRTEEAGIPGGVMGAVGSRFDNTLIEAFWSRVHVELPDRQVWYTYLELNSALF